MTVRKRIICIVVILTVIIISISNTVYGIFFTNYLENQEDAQIDSVGAGLSSYLIKMTERYQGNTDDYSHWDDTYAYVTHEKPDFPDANFTPETLENLDISFVIIIGQNDSVLYTCYYDFNTRNFVPFPKEVSIPDLVILSKNGDYPRMLQFGNQFYFVVSSHVTNTQTNKVADGRIVAGRLIDQRIIRDLQDIAQGNILISSIRLQNGSAYSGFLTSENDRLEKLEVIKDKTIIQSKFLIPNTSYHGSSLLITFSKTRDLYTQGIGHMKKFILIYTVVFILLMIALNHLLGMYISRPFTKIINDVASLDLAQSEIPRLRSEDNDEFVLLRKSINLMLERLETEKNNGLALVMKLAEADIQKNNFLAMLSHEIRNPLASIMLNLTLLDRSTANTEQSIQAREAMARQINQLSHLFDDLLDITRITENKIILHKEPLELNKLLYKIIQDFRPEFFQKDIRIELRTVDTPLHIHGDETRLIQVFDNLMKNAVKYTSPGGYTIVTVTQKDIQDKAYAVMSIRDNGIGIEKNMLDNLFEPFFQADNSRDYSQGGLGLGLAIVKRFIELHNGDITVHSDGIGKGTEFTVKLPLLDDSHLADYRPVQHKNQPLTIQKQRTLRILIIDDLPDISEILCILLTEAGHAVTIAVNGSQGIVKANEIHPDVIICDIGLPDMNGYEVAKHIRENVQTKDIYLIALSGYAMPEDMERSMQAGYHCHLVKPVDLEKLLIELNRV
ncbi:ATP-binding protein [Dehalobacter sp. DCM]|uniref:ATP-binding protein n=1 Tax=Dehalobacter sp. DCM TaxID=2907827 RepID=UPI003081DF25|nr:ATP-binding protein [Dehalobacter sp. DCM]